MLSFLPVVLIVAENTGVQYLCINCLQFLGGAYPEAELLRCVVILSFQGAPVCFPYCLYHFRSLPLQHRVQMSPHPRQHLASSSLEHVWVVNGCPSKCLAVTHCSLGFHFSDVSHLCSSASRAPAFLLGEMSIPILQPFLNQFAGSCCLLCKYSSSSLDISH